MIKDKLENAKIYYSISENLKKGLEWLKNTDKSKLENRRYDIDGDSVYASVQEYETKDNANYEAHRKYIDIQYLVYGVEKVGVTNISNCKTCIEYDVQRDLEFFDIICDEEFVELSNNQFVILFPHDAHKPSITLNDKMVVKKIVVKVAI